MISSGRIASSEEASSSARSSGFFCQSAESVVKTVMTSSTARETPPSKSPALKRGAAALAMISFAVASVAFPRGRSRLRCARDVPAGRRGTGRRYSSSLRRASTRETAHWRRAQCLALPAKGPLRRRVECPTSSRAPRAWSRDRRVRRRKGHARRRRRGQSDRATRRAAPAGRANRTAKIVMANAAATMRSRETGSFSPPLRISPWAPRQNPGST